jgi:hypothetical protein
MRAIVTDGAEGILIKPVTHAVSTQPKENPLRFNPPEGEEYQREFQQLTLRDPRGHKRFVKCECPKTCSITRVALGIGAELITKTSLSVTIARYLAMKNDKEDDLEKIVKPDVSLDAKDYVALAIAALETIFLPLVILVVIIVIIVFLLR